VRNGIHVSTARDIDEQGMEHVCRRAVDKGMERADTLYASIDIDILNRTFDPGTGQAVGISGILPVQLMEATRVLREYPVGAIDMVEVAPCWDPTGRTASMAASFLIEFLHNRLFEDV